MLLAVSPVPTQSSASPLILGIDGGTEGVRVGVLSADGAVLAQARQPYPTTFPRPGWAEQDPAQWWHALTICLRRAFADSHLDPQRVVGIGAAATSFTMSCLGSDDQPLRPAVMWMDSRSTVEADDIRGTGTSRLRYSGGQHASAEWMLSKVLWLRRHEPETFEATTWIADYAEWIAFKLTGERATSLTSAATRGYYGERDGGWPVDLWEALGLGELGQKLSQRVLRMGEVVGALSPAVAAQLGLPAGIPVACGGPDAYVAALGSGSTRPGTLAMVTGSSHVHLLQSKVPIRSTGLFGSFGDAVLPGQHTLEGGQVTTGATIAWWLRLLTGPEAQPQQLAAMYRRLDAEAATLPPGSEGVMALDYLQGNRTPHVDPKARGLLWGLSLSHGPGHIYRALIESVCFGTRAIIDRMRTSGGVIEEIVACGGSLRSPLWMQIHADVAGVPIRTSPQPDAAVVGAAVLAAQASGLYTTAAEACANMVSRGSVIEPDPLAMRAYEPWMNLYEDSYYAMRPAMHRAYDLAPRGTRPPPPR